MFEVVLVVMVALVCLFIGFVLGVGEECPCRADPDLLEVMRTLQTLEHLDLVSMLAQQNMWQTAHESLEAGDEGRQGESE